MPPTPTFWMLQRQVRMEEAGPETVKLSAPNMPAYELSLKPSDAGLTAVLAKAGDSTPVAERPTGFADPERAWQAAFELYRQAVIV